MHGVRGTRTQIKKEQVGILKREMNGREKARVLKSSEFG